ncbi:hypothetical protein [Providencia rettgeri]|uniref:hypothetical protein n=1 Tax=Providencia rettgeri TaxID=587 RepID=UPI0034E0C819
MKIDNKQNNHLASISSNKNIPPRTPSVICNLNTIKTFNTVNYQKINFAIQSRYFHERAQPELDHLPYSPPVEKILLPYKYHEDEFISPSNIFKRSIIIEQNSPKSVKQEDTAMKISNPNSESININRKNLIKDFGINKLKHFFYESIDKINSTGKIRALIVMNKLKPRAEDLYSVKFYSQQRITEIQKTNKQNTETVNNERNLPIAFSGKDKAQFNQAKILKNEIYELEKKILHYDNFSHVGDKFQYTKSVQQLINECILSPSNKRGNKFNATIETMNGIINKLNSQHLYFKENKNTNIETTSKKIMFNSNESLNSNSSGYFSESTDTSEYSSEETIKQNITNKQTINRKNNMQENEKLKNTETPLKKTHITVKPKKKTYQFNGKIYQTKTSMLRAKHNSEKYQFPLHENSPIIISNHGKPETKKLEALLKDSVATVDDLIHLQVEIEQEEAHSAEIKNQLKKLGYSVTA